MTEQMINNICNPKNIQYFQDITYYATPGNNKKYKILVILAFNLEKLLNYNMKYQYYYQRK